MRTYLFVCPRYQRHLWALAQRHSPNQRLPIFTDEEVLTVYLFGLIQKRKTIREIYDYTSDHLAGWFPRLPSYAAYARRLNRLADVFAPLVGEALHEVALAGAPGAADELVRLVDSMPVMLPKKSALPRHG